MPNDAESDAAATSSWADPPDECDLVLKGGATSAVIYPRAIAEFARSYRLRSVGGTSAGAIGAALAAAAEYGRASGGFARLEGLPDELRDDALAGLFQPQRSTRPLLDVLLRILGHDRAGRTLTGARRVVAVLAAIATGFPLGAFGAAVGLPFLAAGIAVLVLAGGDAWSTAAGALLLLAGLVLALLGWAGTDALLLYRRATRDLPANLFGICTGLGESAEHPGLTDWLARRIDLLAGLPEGSAPLTFGQLHRGPSGRRAADGETFVDLRMITTCLSRSRAYEMPWDASGFYYDPEEWRRLFPEYVMAALEAAAPAEGGELAAWQDACARTRPAGARLLRLPETDRLPVIVAVRLSLSYPVLISAVPLYAVDHRSAATRRAFERFEAGERTHTGIEFERLWFTDGALCSNFPVQLFDAALPTRPTFAINLGSADRASDEPGQYIRYARNNSEGMYPPYVEIPETGFAALAAMVQAIVLTPQNWADNSHLDVPGYRDRIVEVLQTREEGGLNLHMDERVIETLAERGAEAARAIIGQFREPHYRVGRTASPTGWDNHRWVRYRALLNVLPSFLEGFRKGWAVLDIDPANPPSYSMTSAAEREAAAELADSLRAAAELVEGFAPSALRALTDTPKRSGRLRRVPQV